MFVLGAGINPQFGEHRSSKWVFRQHTLNRALNDPGRMALYLLGKGNLLDPAGIPGVPMICLRLGLVASNPHLLGIDDHNMVARVDVWRVLGLVFAPQPGGHFACQAPQYLVCSVYDVPLAAYCLGVGIECFHAVGVFVENSRRGWY